LRAIDGTLMIQSVRGIGTEVTAEVKYVPPTPG